jgi:hypothetical protein
MVSSKVSRLGAKTDGKCLPKGFPSGTLPESGDSVKIFPHDPSAETAEETDLFSHRNRAYTAGPLSRVAEIARHRVFFSAAGKLPHFCDPDFSDSQSHLPLSLPDPSTDFSTFLQLLPISS